MWYANPTNSTVCSTACLSDIKENIKARVTGPLWGNSPLKRPVTRKLFLSHDVTMVCANFGLTDEVYIQHSDVIWSLKRLILPACETFVQQVVQDNNVEITNGPVAWKALACNDAFVDVFWDNIPSLKCWISWWSAPYHAKMTKTGFWSMECQWKSLVSIYPHAHSLTIIHFTALMNYWIPRKIIALNYLPGP